MPYLVNADPAAVVPPESGSLWQTDRYPELSDLARTQLGVLSMAQLRSRGWSRHRAVSEVNAGRWTQVAPRVVALQNAPLVRPQLMWLGVLHAGPTSLLTHATASELSGLQWTVDPTIHVMTAKGDLVSPLPGIRFHQTRRRYDDWADRTAPLPRVRVQHAALLTAERDRHLRRAIGLLAAHVQQGLCTPDELMLGIDQIRKVRNGQLFRLALGDIEGGAQSFAEIDVGRLCREAGLREPSRQLVRLDKEGRRRYLDCEWRLVDGRIVVLEVDGSFHMRTEHWVRDMKRERSVVLSGRAVLRCSSVEIRLEPDDIVEDLVAAGIPRFVCDRPA
jgi:hypothetical protein